MIASKSARSAIRRLFRCNSTLLPTHGRYAYSPIHERPQVDWPGNARLAVYLGLNLEHFAFNHGLGAQLVHHKGQGADVLNYSWRDYGNRVGAWRMLDMLDQLDLPATVLANSAMVDYAPSLLRAHLDRGDELAGHGRTNSERQGDMDEKDESTSVADA